MNISSLIGLISLSVHNFIIGFVFYYPLIMAWMWMIGGIYFFIHREMPRPKLPVIKDAQGCSILIPCYNEEDHVYDTIRYALATHYPEFEVIAIDDGSSDRTGEILDELALHEPRLRVLHLEQNQGKAIALRSGAMSSRFEYLVCIDGDALLHPNCVNWMMFHLMSGPRVGAVTGSPRILNRSTLLGKIQVGEFSSIISLIKRAQRTYGRIFTVSGVIVGFRRTALHRVGYWNEEMITEDIDISWQLQMDHWDIRYEPEALCYVYMPETLKGLWQQRLRWAQGGVEVILRYTRDMLGWKQRRFWLVPIEYIIGVTWSYSMLLVCIIFFVGLIFPIPPVWRVDTLFPTWGGLILGVTCLTQFFISLWIDRRYERGHFLRNYIWIIWYPLLYWILSMLTTVVAVPKTLLKKRGERARWESPDRGVNPTDKQV
jgi:biofilm PGA synthesis N-glycosyltransferase PgaC